MYRHFTAAVVCRVRTLSTLYHTTHISKADLADIQKNAQHDEQYNQKVPDFPKSQFLKKSKQRCEKFGHLSFLNNCSVSETPRTIRVKPAARAIASPTCRK
jgi:hypothetical protein